MASAIGIEAGVLPPLGISEEHKHHHAHVGADVLATRSRDHSVSTSHAVRVHQAPEDVSIDVQPASSALTPLGLAPVPSMVRKPSLGAITLNTPSMDPVYASSDEEKEQLTHEARSGRSRALLEQLDSYVQADEVVSDKKLSKGVRKLYAEQNELVDLYKQMVRLEDSSDTANDKDAQAVADASANASFLAKVAIRGSLALTVVMIICKLTAAIWSGSIAIVASAVDSALDIVSQTTLVVANRFMLKKDAQSYPIGKSRVENLSVLIFSVIMSLAAVFLMYQSCLELTNGLHTQPDVHMDAVSISLLGFTIGAQIVAYIFCRYVSKKDGAGSLAVEAVMEDHLNDVCANIVAMGAALIAAFEPRTWWFDAAGGMLIAIYIFTRWAFTFHEQFMALLGRTAEKEFISKLTYLAMVHDERILKVDTVIAYRIGSKYHCEVHIVLPSTMLLQQAHDIGESLEQQIEKSEDVELAWVHLDFEWSHVAEHRRWDL